MIGRRRILASIGALAATPVLFPASAAWALSDSTRVQLQYALRSYLDKRVIDGRYPFKNPKTDVWTDLRLKRVHPTIFRHRAEYLMCADFIDRKGRQVVIDYVLSARQAGFTVTREVIGKRSLLLTFFEKLG